MINCAIVKNLKYNKATATFHQWRDQRQVYGLNFQSPQDAESFSDTVSTAIKYMNLPPGMKLEFSSNFVLLNADFTQLNRRFQCCNFLECL